MTEPDFHAMRAAWIEKGRPADPDDPYWASVLAEIEDRATRPRTPVMPLVRLG